MRAVADPRAEAQQLEMAGQRGFGGDERVRGVGGGHGGRIAENWGYGKARLYGGI